MAQHQIGLSCLPPPLYSDISGSLTNVNSNLQSEQPLLVERSATRARAPKNEHHQTAYHEQ